ncbi:ParB/RepB/Spo0J family partition protein [Kluyvera cryocrescens]|uniref:ParB/RepB/Spo0J family partition protein n=1 Tax=Kluyvera cryocrescens TaxID=580 RepID=A0AAW9CCZ3_KLUCR|nr:ParB/RepB/Spo0J family partition protein [Kluyvera cryocrescens]MDW3779702.1 ParB/RepB/Spo0J family partition protein [Kluyvera cryocrescens]MEB7558743.1 ParB/RepB/Spo0J family partition protein [Kluyvera cryocrescens]
MSVANVKAKSAKKPKKNVISEELKAALAAAVIEFVPLSDLIKSPLNVRTIPYAADSVKRLANSIANLGLLHNLVVHALPDGQSGVAAGGRRLAALNLLRETGRIGADYQVPVKSVSDELAVEASYAENTELEAMHPAEQISTFGTLAAQGKTPAQIGDGLGYGSRHVQRMLKLANLAPALLEKLAKDEINVEQCQALCLESDQERQVQVFDSVYAEWGAAPAHLLRKAITETEVSVTSTRFVFIGREAYEAAGGVVREDLFSREEGAGTADSALVDRLFQEKLETIALQHELTEGWSWSMGRPETVGRYGQDGQDYLLLEKPETVYTDEEQARLDELKAKFNTFDSACDEADELDAEICRIQEEAGQRAWTDEMKASAGVVVSYQYGELVIQRGVCRIADLPAKEGVDTESVQDAAPAVTTIKKDITEGISAPQLLKMSSERTLAVQAALMQQPTKAVALLAWRMCAEVFTGRGEQENPFGIRVTVGHYSQTMNAPSGKEGKAYTAIRAEGERLEALLPEGWRQDLTSFFTLDGGLLMSLMAFCTACSIDGVQERNNGHTSRSKLDALETAIDFHLRDWWHPTKEGYFKGVKHDQIVKSLNDAGMSGAAADAAKMKKSDAAELAEERLKDSRWVPAWLQAPQPVTCDEDQNNTDTPAIAA